MTQAAESTGGRRIFMYFALFFGLIIVVNSVFIYKALSTHTGVVTENAYEKGLAYNETLNKAKAQPEITQEISYEDGILRLRLIDSQGNPITGAQVNAKIIRPVQDGYDFDVVLKHRDDGIYEAVLSVPLTGVWSAKLSGLWNNQEFQTVHKFIAE